MGWQIVEPKIGRAGGRAQRQARQREWDEKYGASKWAVGYVVDGAFVTQTEALETIYYRSYEQHFAQHPGDLRELIETARALRNPHAEATTGVDLQVPAIMDYLARHNLRLRGNEVVDIGSWHRKASHDLSIRLSPLTIRAACDPDRDLEAFWQDEKCLAVQEPDK